MSFDPSRFDPRQPDCTVCGYPSTRSDGHAEWCQRITEYLRQREIDLHTPLRPYRDTAQRTQRTQRYPKKDGY